VPRRGAKAKYEFYAKLATIALTALLIILLLIPTPWWPAAIVPIQPASRVVAIVITGFILSRIAPKRWWFTILAGLLLISGGLILVVSGFMYNDIVSIGGGLAAIGEGIYLLKSGLEERSRKSRRF